MAVIENFEDLHDVAGVDEAKQKKATEFPTAPTDIYNAQVAKVTRIQGDEGRWDEGLEYVRLGAPIVVAGEEEGTQRTLGYANFNVAWKEYTEKDESKKSYGMPLPMCNMWHQLTKALLELEAITVESTVGEVFQAAIDNPIRLSITRNYLTPEGWRTIGKSTPAGREVEYLKEGYDCRNFINRIMTYKED